MIRLVQFAPAFGLPNASPFCMKVETWLRLAGLPYELASETNPMKAPKGKLPFIVDDDGKVVADSQFIVEHLTQRHGVALDAGLAPHQLALATAMQRLFEEDLYWAVLHTRWIDDAGWALTREAFFGSLPPPLKWIFPPLARRGLRAELRGHGMGRHSAEQIHAIARRDLDAVAELLGDQPFMLGDQPHTIDATAYAFLANILWVPLDTPIRRHARTRPNLEAYCLRMKARCFP